MLRIRIKMGPQQRNKEWTCCFSVLHVHTATIIIGLWHLFINIMALSLLAVIWRNPHMMEELESGYDFNVDLNAPALPTPLSKVDPPYPYRDSFNYRRHYQNFDMGGLVCTCMIAITLMMIYGTLKGKPSHLLPFFCLQLFDFAITTLTAAGYICYLQAIHRLIAESHRLPWREKFLQMSQEELMIIVLVLFVSIVFLKAYTIGIVWRCYKYLTLRQQNLRSLLPCVLPELGGTGLVGEERAYTTLLPNYDEAIAQYMKQAPPPSYQVAMSNYERVNAEVDNANANGNATSVILPGAAVVSIDDTMDNNNDTPNNNNTMHVNANTPPMRRNELNVEHGRAAEGAVESAATAESENAGIIAPTAPTDDAAAAAPAAGVGVERTNGELTSAPPYINANGRVSVANGAEQQTQQRQADNRNESQA